MNTNYKEKLVGAPRLGSMIAGAILGTVEAVVNTVEDITDKAVDVAVSAKDKVLGKEVK